MTVTIVSTNSHDKSAQLVQKAAQVTALAAATPSASQAQALNQAQTEEVIACLDARRLDPAAVIANVGVNVNIDPAVGQLITKLATQVGGAADDLLRSARIQAIHNALAKGQINAASVLSTMT